jgi:hypothetical protein
MEEEEEEFVELRSVFLGDIIIIIIIIIIM